MYVCVFKLLVKCHLLQVLLIKVQLAFPVISIVPSTSLPFAVPFPIYLELLSIDEVENIGGLGSL